MKYLFILSVMASTLASCAPHPYTGSYLSCGGEMIEIEANGFMYWSPMTKKQDRFQLVGALSEPQIKGDASIIGPSSTSSLGTTAVLKWAGKVLEVGWNDFRPQQAKERAAKYQRRE